MQCIHFYLTFKGSFLTQAAQYEIDSQHDALHHAMMRPSWYRRLFGKTINSFPHTLQKNSIKWKWYWWQCKGINMLYTWTICKCKNWWQNMCWFAYLGSLMSDITVFSPSSFLRISSSGFSEYGRLPTNTKSFMRKYRPWVYLTSLPVIPPYNINKITLIIFVRSTLTVHY